jgi:hypothetical protein
MSDACKTIEKMVSVKYVTLINFKTKILTTTTKGLQVEVHICQEINEHTADRVIVLVVVQAYFFIMSILYASHSLAAASTASSEAPRNTIFSKWFTSFLSAEERDSGADPLSGSTKVPFLEAAFAS